MYTSMQHFVHRCSNIRITFRLKGRKSSKLQASTKRRLIGLIFWKKWGNEADKENILANAYQNFNEVRRRITLERHIVNIRILLGPFDKLIECERERSA